MMLGRVVSLGICRNLKINFQKFSVLKSTSINMIMKQKTCNLQGNRFFWFSYDEFVSFCIWLSVLHVLLGVNNPSVNQISTCT